ncbi:MAG: hypothetical protein RLZZ175_3363 [Bacteroidota bacterium]|jgi:hypothetical protein
MFDSAIDKLSKDGVKVVATVPNDVYLKLFAVIVLGALFGTLASQAIKSMFK